MSKATSADPLAEKLKSTEGATLLATRWIAQLFAQPIRELVPPSDSARIVHEALSAYAKSADAPRLIAERVEAACKRFENERATVGALLGPPLPDAVLRLARRPHQPHRDVVLEVIDREPVRELIRALLIDSLVDFGRKLASPISGSRVGKGLGALGSLAGAVGAGVLGAVGGELEKQVERKATEFADSALSRVLQNVVEMVTDPRRAQEQGELRAALVQGALDVPARLVAEEVRRADPAALAAEVQRIVRDFAAQPDALQRLQTELEHALAPLGARTVGEELESLGLREVVEQAARDALVKQIRAFDWADAFAALR